MAQLGRRTPVGTITPAAHFGVYVVEMPAISTTAVLNAATIAVGAVAVTGSTIASGGQVFAPTVSGGGPATSSPPSMMTRTNRITRTRRFI